MFSLFAQNPTNVSDTFEMWLNANHTASEAPLRFQFSQSKKLDCIGKQILQLEVVISAVFNPLIATLKPQSNGPSY